MPDIETFSITVPRGCKAKLRKLAGDKPLTKFIAATLATALGLPELAGVGEPGRRWPQKPSRKRAGK